MHGHRDVARLLIDNMACVNCVLTLPWFEFVEGAAPSLCSNASLVQMCARLCTWPACTVIGMWPDS